MSRLHSTRESEQAEIAAAQTDLDEARHGLARAHDAASAIHAPALSRLADAEAAEWVRVSTAERRERAANEASWAGELRRHRNAQWRSLFGLRPVPLPESQAPRERVHEATLDFLEADGAHDTSEDMHPARLDPASQRLDAALTSLQREIL